MSPLDISCLHSVLAFSIRFFYKKIWINSFTNHTFNYNDKEIHPKHWKTPSLAILILGVSKGASDCVGGQTRSRRTFHSWSGFHQTLWSGVTHEKNKLFSINYYFESCMENKLFIENGDLSVYSKHYFLPQISKYKAAFFFASFSSIVSRQTLEIFIVVHFIFWKKLPFFPGKIPDNNAIYQKRIL